MALTLVNANPVRRSTLLRTTNRSSVTTCRVSREVALRPAPSRDRRHLTAPHPEGWSPADHFRWCGQSCPCCRYRVEGPSGLGVCAFCCGGPAATVPCGTQARILQTTRDGDGRTMHLITYAVGGAAPGGRLHHSGWIYAKNVQRAPTFVSPAVANGREIVVTERDRDEDGVVMFRVHVTSTGATGWTYAKNVLEPQGTCAICLEPFGFNGYTSETVRCSHRFHKRCLCEWYRRGKRECPVCRTVPCADA